MSCQNIPISKPITCSDEFGPEQTIAEMFSKAKHSLIDFNEAISNGTFRVFVGEHEVETVSVNDRGHISFNFKKNVSTKG